MYLAIEASGSLPPISVNTIFQRKAQLHLCKKRKPVYFPPITKGFGIKTVLILLFLFFNTLRTSAVIFTITNVQIVNANLTNSKIQIHVNAILSTPCIGVDSCAMHFENNQLLFKLYTRDGICNTPYNCIQVVPPPFDSTFTLCMPSNLNGTYILEALLFESCPGSFYDSSYYALPNVNVYTSPTIAVTYTSCDSVIYLGNTYTNSGTYYFNYLNNIGCDSVVQFNANIISDTTYVINDTFCDQYTFNGSIYYSGGIYFDTVTTNYGCDSIVVLNLTKDSIDITTSQSGSVLSATAMNAFYQWIDCNGNTPIPGANSQFYGVVANGNYAVIVTQNNCSDTSVCINVNGVGIAEFNQLEQMSVLPNPVSSILYIKSTSKHLKQLFNSCGQLLFSTSENEMDISKYAKGIYYIKCGITVTKVVVE